MIMDIYSRLYKYRERPSLSPLENFLTEALADIFNRLPTPIRIDFLVWMLPKACSEGLRRKCKDAKQIEAETQVSIVAAGSVKRPDMIIYLDSKPLVLLESKVHAPIQNHKRDGLEAERPPKAENSETVFQSALETYSKWMSSQWPSSQCSGDWPGAVVFLTHGTQAPKDFENDGSSGNSVIGVTRMWRDIGRWLADNLNYNQSNVPHCTLASDFNHFLKRQGLITDFISSCDITATAQFLPSHKALEHTFDTVIRVVDRTYPQLRGGNFKLEFWPEGNAYWAWNYLNRRFDHDGNKFWIGIGICFPGDRVLDSDDPAGVPQHEPFFFIMISGDAEIGELLNQIPERWVPKHEGYSVIVMQPVSQFEADPDACAQSLIAWAQKEVGRAIACIPNFAAAPVANIPEEPED